MQVSLAPSDVLRAVIVRAQHGDTAAFEELLEQFHAPIFAMLCKWTGNWHDAEDLTQETFLKAYKYLKSFRIDENFKSWLYRIAINLTHNYRSHRNTSVETSLDEKIAEHIKSREDAADERLYRKQMLDVVYQVLPEFTARERSVFVLKTMEGLENDEIAAILGISQTTVRRFYGLIRKKILLRIEQMGARRGK